MKAPTSRRSITAGLAALAALILSVVSLVPSAAAAPAATGTILHEAAPGAISGSYIVRLKSKKSGEVSATARRLADRYGGRLGHVYRASLRGFSVRMDAADAKRLAANGDVAYVEQDQVMHTVEDQINPPSWGLNRIDQRDLPLDNKYSFATRATNVNAYVIDTGIRMTHQDFGGRAKHGRDLYDNDADATDCNGHGSHVSGTVGGSSYGVAKGVTLYGVKVFGCSGSTSNTTVIAGVDWVTANAVKPAVANMSLGGGASQAVDDAVNRSISAGITYALAAGNEQTDACTRSPARTPAAITVGATQQNDARASFSNFGTCLDLFAPGVGITSAWYNSDTAQNTISGTSMASPHVAGAAALILAGNPSATPQQVRDTMVNATTPGKVTNPGTGSPNRLLFTAAADVPPPTAVFTDDFETDKGWTVNPGSGDTATTGAWQRGDPAATTNSGVTLQRGDTTSGSNDLVTGASAGASVGENDIDGGTTSIQSPAITLPAGATLTLSYSWYLGHLNNATNADYIRLRVVGTTTTTVLDQRGATSNRNAGWATATANISAHAGQTVRIVVDAADAATASLVEAGVDDVKITRN